MAHAIEVSGLTKRFGPVLAVDDLSFTADEGRVVGFLGPNGAGKTTTLRMLLGFVNPTSGRATVTGSRYVELGDPVRTGRLGAGRRDVPPGPHAVAITCGRSRRRRGSATPGSTSCSSSWRSATRPTGARAATRSACDSGSAWPPRCSAIRKVLVLDEPANGLDPQGIRWLRDFLRTLAEEGRAVLVSSHVLAEVAQTADDVVVINSGRSVAQAPLAEIMARSGGGMKVAGPDVRKLGDILHAQGAQVTGDAAEILVRERTGEQIGRVIAEHQLVISELAPVGSSARGDLLRTHRRRQGGPS